MPYDDNDPYDAAAWWHMQFACQDCGVTLDHDLASVEVEGSDAYWHEYAQRALKEGWHVRELSVTPAAWTVLCPACVKKASAVTR